MRWYSLAHPPMALSSSNEPELRSRAAEMILSRLRSAASLSEYANGADLGLTQRDVQGSNRRSAAMGCSELMIGRRRTLAPVRAPEHPKQLRPCVPTGENARDREVDDATEADRERQVRRGLIDPERAHAGDHDTSEQAVL